jgi:hypothetical protein
VEWFASNYDKFGATLELVTNRSQEGTQFCRGFGGVGGLLRWKVRPLPVMSRLIDAHLGIDDQDVGPCHGPEIMSSVGSVMNKGGLRRNGWGWC